MTISPEVVRVYDRYIALARMAKKEFSGTLAGKFLLVAGFAPDVTQLVFAAGIASAVSLVVESGSAQIYEAKRIRACEFIVSTLDEAVRILKNQIRKRQAAGLLLQSEIVTTLEAMLTRGLQPDLVASCRDEAAEGLVAQFQTRGALALDLRSLERSGAEDSLDVWWKVPEAPGRWLPKIDTVFVGLFPNDSRSHWIQAAPSYLDRPLQFERYVRLSPTEAALFAEALANGAASGEIGASVLLKIGEGKEQLIAVR